MMKRLAFLFLFSLFFNFYSSYAQIVTAAGISRVWYLSVSQGDSLIYQKDPLREFNSGYYIEFKDESNFIDGYSAECGNDRRIYSHKGTWVLTKDSILITSIPLGVDKSSKHKIVFFNGYRLILKKVL